MWGTSSTCGHSKERLHAQVKWTGLAQGGQCACLRVCTRVWACACALLGMHV